MDEVQVKVKPEMVTVYIMGQAYQVPAGLTILKALEYAGFRLVRGGRVPRRVLRSLRYCLSSSR
jgi:hypothetical protein